MPRGERESGSRERALVSRERALVSLKRGREYGEEEGEGGARVREATRSKMGGASGCSPTMDAASSARAVMWGMSDVGRSSGGSSVMFASSETCSGLERTCPSFSG